MRASIRLLSFSFLACLLFSCAGKGKTQEQKLPDYKPGTVPAPITSGEEILKYRIFHYWDLFPFDDIRCVLQEGYAEKAFTHFVQLLQAAEAKVAKEGVIRMVSGIDKAEKADTVQKQVLFAFNDMAEHYFHHPNLLSEMMNCTYPYWVFCIKSLPDTLEKARPSFLLNWAYKNRVGSPATDFHFEQAFQTNKKPCTG